MRFLDLDLDFFLNKNAYSRGYDGGRLGPEYKPWSAFRVRRFLEDRCGLLSDAPVCGRTLESHDSILGFWKALIESGRLRVPFDVIHVDAHPDIWVGDGLYRTPEYLYIDTRRGPAMLKKKPIHPGNYLTFAISYGWLSSLVWVSLLTRGLPRWDADARSILMQFKKKKADRSSVRGLPVMEKERGVSFRMLPWHKFRTGETFDYIALSRSPDFTPPESDSLIPVIEAYIKQI